MTREGRKFIDPCDDTDRQIGGLPPYLSMLVNNIDLDGAAIKKTPPDFIVYALAMNGGIAYSPELNEWAEFVQSGTSDRYGMPRTVRLIGDGGDVAREISVADARVHIYPANAEFIPPIKQINRLLARLNEVEINIQQNMVVMRQATAIIVEDDSLDKELKKADKDRRSGATQVILHKRTGATLELANFSPNCQNYLPTYLEYERELLRRLDNATGVIQVDEKNERRIQSEISAIEEGASAQIDLIISSINRYAKYYGDDILARRKGVHVSNTEQNAKQEGEKNEQQ